MQAAVEGLDLLGKTVVEQEPTKVTRGGFNIYAQLQHLATVMLLKQSGVAMNEELNQF